MWKVIFLAAYLIFVSGALGYALCCVLKDWGVRAGYRDGYSDGFNLGWSFGLSEAREHRRRVSVPMYPTQVFRRPVVNDRYTA